MTEGRETEERVERKIARQISELPKLSKNYVRAVHITHPNNKENLLANGLNYEKNGEASAMVRAWGNADEVEVWSDDPRFSYPGAKALIMDMPNGEWRIHANLTRSDIPLAPGIIPAKWIVGFVDAKKPERSS